MYDNEKLIALGYLLGSKGNTLPKNLSIKVNWPNSLTVFTEDSVKTIDFSIKKMADILQVDEETLEKIVGNSESKLNLTNVYLNVF